MTSRHALRVAPEQAGTRLDVLVGHSVPGLSRSQAQELIRDGRVTVGGEVRARPAWPVRVGDEVVVTIPPPEPSAIEAEPIELDVLYEDAEVLVIDKPPGMVVHPAAGHRRGTLVHALLARYPGLVTGVDTGRPGIVHRLDKDTSGCLIVARTSRARESLMAQFQAREIDKCYLAVVHGRPPSSGFIDAPVGRDPRHRKRMSTRSTRGRSAQTLFRVRAYHAWSALLEVHIHTGRTHQIRVHLAALGHPVVGDELYGGTRRRFPEPLRRFPRQALHAAEVAFRHPTSGEVLRITAPLPIDIRGLLAALERSE